jgi:tetratricopeptide (TPR) repeat protein
MKQLIEVAAKTPNDWIALADSATLAQVAKHLPDQSVSLTEFSVTVAAEVVNRARRSVAAAGGDIDNKAKSQPGEERLAHLALSLNNFGVRLSAVGRREDALRASQEAVDIRRALANERPDAFLPNLAMSLGAMSQTLVGAERFAEAAAAAREGLEAIAPFAEAQPQAFGGLAGALARAHVEASEKAGAEPDLALMERVAKALGLGS